MNVAVLLSQAAKTFADAPALMQADRVVCDYSRLGRRAAGLAAAFGTRLGLSEGDRVALVMRNRPCYIELLFACWHAGLVAVPVNARLHPQEIQFILRDCGARACFVSEELAASIGALRETLEDLEHVVGVDEREYESLAGHEPVPARTVRPESPAWLFYTSGTTGRPKGAVLSHRSLMAMTLSHLADVDQLGPTDTFIHVGPQSHAVGLFSIPFTARGARHVLPASGGFDAAELFDVVGRLANVTFFSTPTMLRRLLEAPGLRSAAIERIRTILCGAAPLYLGDVERTLRAFGPRLWIGYGQGESPLTITALPKEMLGNTTHPRHRARMESVGYARAGVEVQVVDEEDRPVLPGTVGEVVVRGDVVMAGYWNQPKATRETLRGGWLHTGDLGIMDDDGLLTLKDRCKDLIISGGMNIYPREVEQAFLHHSGIREIAVVGVPDREWGERVVAFVVPRGGVALAEGELDAYCLRSIARFKRPRRYVFVDELPKNNYGKVLKTELRVRAEHDEAPTQR